MIFHKSTTYDEQPVKENLMGPNSLKMLEELTRGMGLHPGMKVLDLGCGKGLTPYFLQKSLAYPSMQPISGLAQRKTTNASKTSDLPIR